MQAGMNLVIMILKSVKASLENNFNGVTRDFGIDLRALNSSSFRL